MEIGTQFERLDQKYLDSLVRRSIKRDSNAAAELFSATGDRQLLLLTLLYGDRDTALARLAEAASRAYLRMPTLADPDIFLVWFSRISSEIYLEERHGQAADEHIYSLAQILELPLIESQILLMHCCFRLPLYVTADILNLDHRSVRRFIKTAVKRLESASDKNKRAQKKILKSILSDAGSENIQMPAESEITSNEMAVILDRVFDRTGCAVNSVPLEELSSYAVYRRERFLLQRVLIAAALVLFMLMPLCFITAGFTLEEGSRGTRGLPVYDVNISSVIPVSKVIAYIGDTELPVYESDPRSYTVEPTGNGSMSVAVELMNHQRTVKIDKVDSVDSEAPRLISNTPGKDTICLNAEDDGIGIDYHEIYAKTADGDILYPVSADETSGIVFEYPTEDWDIYIPDRLGNTLHLHLRLE